jgi:hypothetical protein
MTQYVCIYNNNLNNNQNLMTACNLLEKLYYDTTLGLSIFDLLMYTAAEAIYSPASYWNDPKNPLQLSIYFAKIDNF